VANATHVIIGAGLAGAKAAEALRTAGFTGRVVLLGDESERPYERPPLSKEILRGEADDGTAYVHPENFYRDRDIDLRLGCRVQSLDTTARTVTTEEGQTIGFDRLLIATGAEPRRLDIPGAGLDGIHYLRTLPDSRDLRTALRGARRLVVVGAGWIGCEVAASARQLGVDVAMIDPMGAPLVRVLGPELGRVYLDLHSEHEVEPHMHTSVAAFSGADRVNGVVTGDGAVIDADVVVVGIGVEPRLDLARAAGLALEGGGISVDATLETSASGVFAAGDVAAAWHPVLDQRLRVEHWANALNQGELAGRNMLGERQAYDRVPYFFSDQYDFGMEYRGHATAWDQVVLRGDARSRDFIAFWLSGGAVVAALNANRWDDGDALTALVDAGAKVEAARLADEDVPLDGLAGVR
jgi:3-phenylpropionate/trans-cinnamate dioxygenase ferredoxin reductase component